MTIVVQGGVCMHGSVQRHPPPVLSNESEKCMCSNYCNLIINLHCCIVINLRTCNFLNVACNTLNVDF